jgi:flagellar basal-body rod protein FlgG
MSFGALHVARTGLDAQSFRMQVIANNLANVNTTGFKRDRANFETLGYQMMTQPGAPSSSENRYAVGLNLGTGVELSGTARIDTQGTLNATGNALDMAIEGAGFFQVQLPDGRTGYTRAGNFSMAADGTVSATVPGQAEATELGRIEIARFVNPSGLQAIGDNILVETQASGAPQVGAAGEEGRGILRAQMLEGSNVNVVEELVDMIETQRAYEVNSKMIQATDEMMKNATQTL